MLTAYQRKELEAIVAEMRASHSATMHEYADRIAAVLANGVEE
jgi:hypothetical protein